MSQRLVLRSAKPSKGPSSLVPNTEPPVAKISKVIQGFEKY